MIFRTYFEFSFSFIKYPKTASISGKSGISGTGTGLKFVPVPMPDRVRAQFFMPNARRVFRAFRVFGQTGNPIPGLVGGQGANLLGTTINSLGTNSTE